MNALLVNHHFRCGKCGHNDFLLHESGFATCIHCDEAPSNIVFAVVTPELKAEKVKLLDELLGDITFAEALEARGWRKP